VSGGSCGGTSHPLKTRGSNGQASKPNECRAGFGSTYGIPNPVEPSTKHSRWVQRAMSTQSAFGDWELGAGGGYAQMTGSWGDWSKEGNRESGMHSPSERHCPSGAIALFNGMRHPQMRETTLMVMVILMVNWGRKWFFSGYLHPLVRPDRHRLPAGCEPLQE
jgi:hypothetical protein